MGQTPPGQLTDDRSPSVAPYPRGTEEHDKFDNVIASGVTWTAGVKWISQIITWSTTIIIARMLKPSDYGLIGMAAAYLALISLFNEFGLGTAIVTLRNMGKDLISQLNTLSLLLGFFCFALSVAASHPLGRFFKAPQLPRVLIVMSIGFLLSSLRTIPNALLEKDMRFKLLAVLEGIQSVVTAILTLTLALLGFAYWALALGNLSGYVIGTTLTLIFRREGFMLPRRAMLREPIRFSRHLVAGRLSWYAYDNSDFVVAGRVLGEASLGAYTIAWTIAHVPLEKLTTLVNRVTPTVFGAIQGDSAALRRYLRHITGGLALVIYPVTLGMALVAADFVHVVFGQKWNAAILPLQLLALHALIRSNVILLSPLLNSIGEARFGMWNNLVSLGILPVSFYIGSRWGVGGIASMWVLVYPFLTLPLFWRVFQKIEMSLTEYISAIWPASSGCVLMAMFVEIVKHFLRPQQSLYFRLAAEVSVGVLGYVLVLILVHRKYLGNFLTLIKSFRYLPVGDLP